MEPATGKTPSGLIIDGGNWWRLEEECLHLAHETQTAKKGSGIYGVTHAKWSARQ